MMRGGECQGCGRIVGDQRRRHRKSAGADQHGLMRLAVVRHARGHRVDDRAGQRVEHGTQCGQPLRLDRLCRFG